MRCALGCESSLLAKCLLENKNHSLTLQFHGAQSIHCADERPTDSLAFCCRPFAHGIIAPSQINWINLWWNLIVRAIITSAQLRLHACDASATAHRSWKGACWELSGFLEIDGRMDALLYLIPASVTHLCSPFAPLRRVLTCNFSLFVFWPHA